MNEIDEILLNIDKDDDNLFPKPGAEAKRNEEIAELIESLDAKSEKNESAQAGEHEEHNDDARASGHVETPAAVPEQDFSEENRLAAVAIEGIFTLRGTKNWNRREPYMIPIDPEGYRNDVESLQKAFYFVEEPTVQDDIKQKIKEEIVAFLRKPKGHITDRYTDFICKKVIQMDSGLAENFKLDQDAERLFIYHIGPLTVYKYLKDDFNQNKYGYCYKYLPGNKAARFFPDDFIKTTVLKWFEENINTLNLPFDSIQKYEEMKKIATRKYYNDLRIFNNRLEQLNLKLGAEKSISRIKLFQVKGIQWFGHMNLEIYRRFIGGTIFM